MNKAEAKRRACHFVAGLIGNGAGYEDYFLGTPFDDPDSPDRKRLEEALTELEDEMLRRSGQLLVPQMADDFKERP